MRMALRVIHSVSLAFFSNRRTCLEKFVTRATWLPAQTKNLQVHIRNFGPNFNFSGWKITFLAENSTCTDDMLPAQNSFFKPCRRRQNFWKIYLVNMRMAVRVILSATCFLLKPPVVKIIENRPCKHYIYNLDVSISILIK